MKNKLLVTQINMPPGVNVYLRMSNESFLLVTIHGKDTVIRFGIEEKKPLSIKIRD
jgi:hypothetical protein